ncbi:MAG TPA: FtsX-like permease family protein, partial [Nocardioides sp.]
MPTTLFATEWMEVRAHRTRSLALVLVAVLGAALISAALVLGARMQRAVDQGIGVDVENADLILEAGLSTSQAKEIARTDGVEVLGTHVRTRAVAQVVGVTRGILIDSQSSADRFRWQRWSRGRAPAAPTEIALTRHALDQLRIQVGDEVALGRAGTERTNFRVVGEVDTRGSFRHAAIAYGILTPEAAHELSGSRRDNVALVSLDEGADRAAVADRIEAVASVEPRATADLARAGVGGQADWLADLASVGKAFAAVAVVVVALLLLALFLISLESRRRAVALLRCAGASRAQVLLGVVFETLVLGLAGAVLGTVLGVLLVRGLAPVAAQVPFLPSLPPDAVTVPGEAW